MFLIAVSLHLVNFDYLVLVWLNRPGCSCLT